MVMKCYMVKYLIIAACIIAYAWSAVLFLSCYSNAAVEGHRAELNRTLPHVRKCLRFENERP